MAGIVYLLCCGTALLCAILLLRFYRRGGNRLLLWSGICFCGLTMDNFLLFVDRIVVPDTDLSTWRLVPGALGLAALLYGLVYETR